MITIEEIAQVAYKLLTEAQGSDRLTISGVVDYERTDYTREDVIIVPHRISGEDSVRFGRININIHVPDLTLVGATGESITRRNDKRLLEITKQVVEILQNHVETESGWNWYIGSFDAAIKEPAQSEHFKSLALEVVVREKKQS